MSAPPSPAQKPADHEATVEEVRMDTHDTATLFLRAPEEPFVYRAGQFMNIDPHQFPALAQLTRYLEAEKGRKEPVRAYSLASAPHEARLAITVQAEEYVPGLTRYPPLLSPYLAHGRLTGARLRFSGFFGPYVLPDDAEAQTPEVVHVVAGSGAVPNFSIVKDALHRDLRVRHTFIASNKTWADVLYKDELALLEKLHPARLRVVHTLTREPNPSAIGEALRTGRVSLSLLAEHIPDPQRCLVYVCGPAISTWDRRKALETRTPAAPRFLETVLGYLHELGVPDKRIKREAYG